jgi:hypothetical protein
MRTLCASPAVARAHVLDGCAPIARVPAVYFLIQETYRQCLNPNFAAHCLQAWASSDADQKLRTANSYHGPPQLRLAVCGNRARFVFIQASDPRAGGR